MYLFNGDEYLLVRVRDAQDGTSGATAERAARDCACVAQALSVGAGALAAGVYVATAFLLRPEPTQRVC